MPAHPRTTPARRYLLQQFADKSHSFLPRPPVTLTQEEFLAMARLILSFDGRELRDLPVGTRGMVIGRSPDNDVMIDNLAVSNHHARITWVEEQLFVEDLQSLNGTFVNDMRIERSVLQHGDSIKIGKHALLVDTAYITAVAPDAGNKPVAPKVDETVVLDTKHARDMFQQAAAMGERAQVSPNRKRVPSLVVLKGKTDRAEYQLTNKLTVIGKSKMATVQLRGWFTPNVAAQITNRDDGFYIGSGAHTPIVNGAMISGQKKLSEGDAVEVGKVHFQFTFRD
jgi:pSer/pThr/pTyr-binding forkhead associated (FHA) protein